MGRSVTEHCESAQREPAAHFCDEIRWEESGRRSRESTPGWQPLGQLSQHRGARQRPIALADDDEAAHSDGRMDVARRMDIMQDKTKGLRWALLTRRQHWKCSDVELFGSEVQSRSEGGPHALLSRRPLPTFWVYLARIFRPFQKWALVLVCYPLTTHYRAGSLFHLYAVRNF